MNENVISHEIKLKKLLSGLIKRKVHFYENTTNENSENKVLFALSSSLVQYNFSSGYIVGKYNLPSKILNFHVDNSNPSNVIIQII